MRSYHLSFVLQENRPTDEYRVIMFKAINTVIQGSAADLMKTAMIKMSKNLRKWKGPPSERPHML